MNKYAVQGIVGEGAYGVVIRCRHKESGEVRAIKKFRESEDDEAVRKTAVREVKILKMLRHDSIVHLHEAFRRKGRLYLVFEFMPMNMLDMLQEHPRGRSLQDTRKYLQQLVHAIDWCHQHSVIHRDIKPENLLVDEARGLLKLCDFGFSRMLPVDGRAAELTDYVATRWYRSPELLLGLTHYGYEVDIWAIGCIMGELLDGAALFPGESDVDQLFIIQTVLGPLTEEHREAFLSCDLYTGVQLPEVEEDGVIGLEAKYGRKVGRGEMAAAAIDFMTGVLAIDRNERLTAERCVDHPFFDAVDEPLQHRQHKQCREQGFPRQHPATINSQTRPRQPGTDGQHHRGRDAMNVGVVHLHGGGDVSTGKPMPHQQASSGSCSIATSVYANSWRRHEMPQHVDKCRDSYLHNVPGGPGRGDRQRSESDPVVGSTGNSKRLPGGSTSRRVCGRDTDATDGPYTQRPSSQGTSSQSTWSENCNWRKERCNEQDCRRKSNGISAADYRVGRGDLEYAMSVAGVRDAAAGDLAANSLKLCTSFASPHSHPQSLSQVGEFTQARRDARGILAMRISNGKETTMSRSSRTHRLDTHAGIASGRGSKGSFAKGQISATLPFMMNRQLPALGVAVPHTRRRPM